MTTPLYSHIFECLKCVKQQYKWILLKHSEVCVKSFGDVSGKLENYAWKMSQCNTFPALKTTPIPFEVSSTGSPLIETVDAPVEPILAKTVSDPVTPATFFDDSTTAPVEAWEATTGLQSVTETWKTSTLSSGIAFEPAKTTSDFLTRVATTTFFDDSTATSVEPWEATTGLEATTQSWDTSTLTPGVPLGSEEAIYISKFSYYALIAIAGFIIGLSLIMLLRNIIYFRRPGFHDIALTVLAFFGRLQAQRNGMRRGWAAREDVRHDATVRMDVRREQVVIEGLAEGNALMPPIEDINPVITIEGTGREALGAIPLMMAVDRREETNSSTAIEMTSFRYLESQF